MRRLCLAFFTLATQLHLAGAAAAATDAPKPTRFFLSGHSLTDDPLAAYVAAIAQSLGQPLTWQQQIVIGSTIRWRTRGDDKGQDVWLGYGYGKNKNGKNGLNVLDEFAAADGPRRYDTMIIAEGHKIVAHLMWSDSVRVLRHYHERFIGQNAAGRTFLYVPWESMRDKAQPADWLRIERSAAPVWGCIAGRINTSLAAAGRTDRISLLPMNLALGHLLEETLAGRVPNWQGLSTGEAVNRIFSDDVHLTRTAVYFAALFTYSTISELSTVGAWHPADIPAEQAAAFQRIADAARSKFVTKAEMAVSLADCRRHMLTEFCDAWNGYVPPPSERQNGCKAYFGRDTLELAGQSSPNPFAYDPVKDDAYWLPPPRR